MCRYIPKALAADSSLRLCKLYDNEDLGLPSAEEVELEMGTC